MESQSTEGEVDWGSGGREDGGEWQDEKNW